MTDALHILKVALDVPLDRVFDYRTDKPNTQIGQYVVVPFGARKMIGVVVGISDTTAIESKKLKYSVGDNVNITEGPFSTFNGIISELVGENKVDVEVKIFGRNTIVSLTLSQIEKA